MQIINELFSLMTLIKMGAVILFVVGLSVLAEVVSTRVAGILSGYPAGAAIALFFMGLEINPGFAAQSALHTSAGVVATLVFTYFYYKASVLAERLNCISQIAIASFAGVAGFLAAAFALSFVPTSFTVAIVLPVLAIIVFTRLFRTVQNVKIGQRVNMSIGMLLIRALFAATTVVFIIATAKLVGPTWAGLFSAFPNIILPLVVIIQLTYSADQAYVILKNAPRGLASVVIYCITVSLAYPAYGIYAGTAMGYGMATVYLVATQFRKELLGVSRGAAQSAEAGRQCIARSSEACPGSQSGDAKN